MSAFAASPQENARHVSFARKMSGWLRLRGGCNAPINPIECLSNERLRDVGVKRHHVTCQIVADLARIDLRQLGSMGLR